MKSENYNNIYRMALLILFIFIAPWSLGQEAVPSEVREDFSDDELSSFVDAYEDVLVVQKETEQKMVEAIEKENLTIERFNEVLAMQQAPDSQMDATADELNSFSNAAESIIKERKNAEAKVIAIIEDKGLDLDTYQEIMVAYQYSPKVQERLNELMERPE